MVLIMAEFDPKAVMARDVHVHLSAKDESYMQVTLPRTPFNIASAIQSLQQEHSDLIGDFAEGHDGFPSGYIMFHVSPEGVKWIGAAPEIADLRDNLPCLTDRELSEECHFVILPMTRIIPASVAK